MEISSEATAMMHMRTMKRQQLVKDEAYCTQGVLTAIFSSRARSMDQFHNDEKEKK